MEDAAIGRYAPYILQNLTSLPLSYCIFQGSGNSVKLDAKEAKGWSLLQSGSSVPIYSNETPEEQLLRFRPTGSSGQLNEKQSSGVAHHFISIKLDGTSVPSVPISMDLVGFSYFEVDFSKASNKLELEKTVDIPRYANLEEDIKTNVGEGFIVPVVFDVSVQRFSKLIRLYSTVCEKLLVYFFKGLIICFLLIITNFRSYYTMKLLCHWSCGLTFHWVYLQRYGT